MTTTLKERTEELATLMSELRHLETAEQAYEEKYYETMSWLKNIRRKKSEIIDTIIDLDPLKADTKMTFGDDMLF